MPQKDGIYCRGSFSLLLHYQIFTIEHLNKLALPLLNFDCENLILAE